MNVVEVFGSKVSVGPDCWEWQGTRSKWGYGRFRPYKKRTVAAHRFMYELMVGPIPVGLVLDHLCRNPGCVNPEHLEAVTDQENILRGVGSSAKNAKKTECPRGHALAGDNLVPDSRGYRECKICKKEKDKKRWAEFSRLGITRAWQRPKVETHER